MMIRAAAAWVLLAMLMVANGVARELSRELYGFRMSEYTVHVVSTAIGIVLVFAVAGAFVRMQRMIHMRAAWGVGVLWLSLTVVFEAALGYVGGKSWLEVLAMYDVSDGSVWPVVVLAVAIAPVFWTHHFRSRARRPDARVHFPLIPFPH